MQYSQDPCPGWVTHNGRIITVAEVLAEEQGVGAPRQHPSPGVLH